MAALLGWMRVLLQSRFLRIVIIGGIGFVIQTCIFELLGIYLHLLRPSIAAVLGGEVGVLVNFFLNERYSFQERVTHKPPLLPRLMRFHLVVAGSLFIQWALLSFTEAHTQSLLLIHLSYVSGLVLGFISNYIGYHLFVWKPKAPEV